MRPSRKTPSAQPGTPGLSYGRKTESIALRWARSNAGLVATVRGAVASGDCAATPAATPKAASATTSDLDISLTCGGGCAWSRAIVHPGAGMPAAFIHNCYLLCRWQLWRRPNRMWPRGGPDSYEAHVYPSRLNPPLGR